MPTPAKRQRIFAVNLRKILNNKGWRQADLARESGLTPGAINDYLKRGSLPNVGIAHKIASALDVPIEALLTGRADDGFTRSEAIPVLGQIPAGPLSEALENREGEVAVPEALLPARAGPYFALRVDGESMICAGVVPGALAIFRQQPTVKNGEIAAVIWGGEATLKRFYRYPEMIILQPANPAYQPTLIPRSQARGLKIVGRLLLVITDVTSPG